MFVGLALGTLMLILIDGGDVDAVFGLIGSWPLQAFICVVIGPLIGHLVGAWAGKKILLQGWNAWLVSPLVGFACVWATTFLFSLVGYFNEGIHGWDSEHAVRDYIVNPLLSVTFFGGLFILIASLVMAVYFDGARHKHFSAQP